VPVQSGNKVKTDKRDSQKLAWYLAKGLLADINVPLEEVLEDREVLRTRSQLVQHRGDIERQIRSKLLFYGKGEWLSVQHKWSDVLVCNLRKRMTGTALEIVVEPLLQVRAHLIEAIRGLEIKLKKMRQKETYAPAVQILASAYGIGELSAITIWLEIGGNIQRFNNSRQWCSYLGLTPAEYSSGEHIRRGRITRCGNNRIRSLLVEGSWIAIRHDQQLREFYERLRSRCGGKRAIVAVARKMACRLRRMLLDGQEYRVAA
jgi:transposase